MTTAECAGRFLCINLDYINLNMQVAIALSGGEVIYFEMDQMGQLLEERKREMEEDVMCLDLAPVPEGLVRSRWVTLIQKNLLTCIVFAP